jgi:hypothetical protein
MSYAQTLSGLAGAAKDYIVESYERVQKVVGLKIDPTSLDASLTVWCPTLEVEDGITLVGYKKSVNSDRLRDVHGNALTGSFEVASLRPRSTRQAQSPGAQLDKGVKVTYEKIVGYIRESEDERESVRDIPAPRQIRGSGLDLNRRRMTLTLQMNASTSARRKRARGEKDGRCFIRGRRGV